MFEKRTSYLRWPACAVSVLALSLAIGAAIQSPPVDPGVKKTWSAT